jgi:hypothetical protein
VDTSVPDHYDYCIVKFGCSCLFWLHHVDYYALAIFALYLMSRYVYVVASVIFVDKLLLIY